MTERAMLDVSMLAHRGTVTKLLKLLEQRPEALSGLVVPARLTQLIRSLAGQAEDEFGIEFIHRNFGLPRSVIDIHLMRRLLEHGAFRNQVMEFDGARNEARPVPFQRMFEVMGDERAAAIALDEWTYLMDHSWLFSKTRRVYDHIVDAGGNALYLTKKKLEHAVRTVKGAADEAGAAIMQGSDYVVAKTIKKKRGEKISPNDRVRAMAKWVAVGGSAATSLMVPVAGVAVGTLTGMFLLYDP